MADSNIPHLGDLTDLNDLAPRHPKLNGVDGFQNAHIIATNLWERALGNLMAAIDPDGKLSPNMASNVRHAPETKPGGMALGTWVHNGQQQKAFDEYSRLQQQLPN